MTNRKSHMSFRLVPKSVTLNDLEWRNGRYIALFHWIWWTCVPFQHITASICGGIYAEVFCFCRRVRYRRKKCSHSLSHLLMSLLLVSLLFECMKTIGGWRFVSDLTERQAKSSSDLLDGLREGTSLWCGRREGLSTKMVPVTRHWFCGRKRTGCVVANGKEMQFYHLFNSSPKWPSLCRVGR